MDYAIETVEDEPTQLGVRLEFVDSVTKKVRTKLMTVNDYEMGPHIVTERFSEAGGTISVTVQGSGKAVLQLSQSYNRESLSVAPVSAFDTSLSVTSDSGHVQLESCHSWLCPYQTGYSGPAVVSVTLPSGYIVTRDMIQNMEDVVEVNINNNTVYLYYNYVSTQSFKFQILLLNLKSYLPSYIQAFTVKTLKAFGLKLNSYNFQLSASIRCVRVPMIQQWTVTSPDNSDTMTAEVTVMSSLAPEHFVQKSIRIPSLPPSPVATCHRDSYSDSAASYSHSQLILIMFYTVIYSCI